MKKKGVFLIYVVSLIIMIAGYLIKTDKYSLRLISTNPSNHSLVEAKEKSGELLTGELKLKDFEIMGINLDHTLEEVKQILGEPERIIDTVIYRHSTNKEKYKRYIYPNIELEIYLPLKGIVEISVPRPGYKTNRGIQVGDRREKIIKAYGNEYFESTFEGKDLIVYYYFEERKDAEFDLELCLHFVLENDIVTEIKIYEAWD